MAETFHFNISMISRGKSKSAVASAAYISCEKIKNEWDGEVHDYHNKKGLLHSEIFLPENVPIALKDRTTLWNSVELNEKASNAQLARNFIIALPKELSFEENKKLITDFIQEHFVSKGMIADLAIHDESDEENNNIHAHIMTTLRPINKKGEWLAKSKKEYVLDEKGEKIKLKSGNYKTRKVELTDWKVIGATNKKDGYYEGNGYKVSWCVGHLIQMANPDSYDEKYAKWNMDDLPIIPREYKYVVSKATKKQFNTLKKLMNDKDVDTVVNACDAGREGEAIFRLVYNEAHCKKKMERLWISSMEDSAIKDGFDNLKEGKFYDNLFESAQARAIADWLVGMNISRFYSCLYKKNYSVGRVQTPTLSMIVNRDEEITNFKKEKYFTVELSLNGFTLSTDRIDDGITAEQLLNLVGDKIEITDVIQKEKITKPDLPFDLTTLQRECNKYFGYSAKQTLDYAQSLYEKKLITYPRTDSRCLTEDMITSTINHILGKNDFDTGRIKTVFNSKKVTDHHAIIPTTSSMNEDLISLPESELKVYRLILNKFHASVGYPLIENTTKIVAEFDSFEFTSSGKVIKDDGFTKYLKEYKSKKNEDTLLPDVSIDDVLSVENKKIKEKYTTPPKHFTEDTLLKAMELAGNDALEKDVEVERKGLGTPATRAGIIENLIYKGFVERDKKNLIATNKGISLVTIVSDTFKSAETTAEWEMKLSDIANGKADKDDFLKCIENEIRETVGIYRK